jgi:hypothetical protein
MRDKTRKRLYRFEVRLIETVTVKAESEEKARLALLHTPPHYPPSRWLGYGEPERIEPDRSIRQEDITLLSAEDDPHDTAFDQAMFFTRALDKLWERVRALEAKLADKHPDPAQVADDKQVCPGSILDRAINRSSSDDQR